MRVLRLAVLSLAGSMLFLVGCKSSEAGNGTDYKAFGEYDTYYPVEEGEEAVSTSSVNGQSAPLPQTDQSVEPQAAPVPTDNPPNPFTANPGAVAPQNQQSNTQLAQASTQSSPKSSGFAPQIISREAWGSEPDLAGLVGDEQIPDKITIHHAGVEWSAGSDPAQKLKGLQAWGKRDKGWPDVPYHYLITPDGRIYEGRDVRYQPETNTNYDTRGHVSVHLWGNFETQRVTLEQLKATVDTIAWLVRDYNIEASTIAGHKDRQGAGGTACPGADLSRYVDQGLIKKWVEQKLAGETPDIAVLPVASGGPVEFAPY